MEQNHPDNFGRLFEAADVLLAMGDGANVPASSQVIAMIRGGSVALSGFTKTEILNAHAMLVRLGLVPKCDVTLRQRKAS